MLYEGKLIYVGIDYIALKTCGTSLELLVSIHRTREMKLCKLKYGRNLKPKPKYISYITPFR